VDVEDLAMIKTLFVAALGLSALIAATAQAQPPTASTQVRFTGPNGIQVRWLTRTPDGNARFSEPPLEVPGRYGFRQGAAYRLKLTHIPGYPGLELYPTLEVWPARLSGG
jgi:hypothetical protein